MKPVQLTLPPDLIAALEAIGAGSISEGVRVVTLAWLESNRPAPRELQVWRHVGGAYYLILWQGVLRGACGPLPLEEALPVAQGKAPEPPAWDTGIAEWVDGEWDAGRMARVWPAREVTT